MMMIGGWLIAFLFLLVAGFAAVGLLRCEGQGGCISFSAKLFLCWWTVCAVDHWWIDGWMDVKMCEAELIESWSMCRTDEGGNFYIDMNKQTKQTRPVSLHSIFLSYHIMYEGPCKQTNPKRLLRHIIMPLHEPARPACMFTGFWCISFSVKLFLIWQQLWAWWKTTG